MDLNGDGFNDIFSGCYSQRGHDGMVGSFWVLYGDKEGKFAKPVELTGTDGKLLCVTPDFDKSRMRDNICTRPTAVDWDGDGDLDIVTGNFDGTFFLFKGEGKGKFTPGATMLKDPEGKPLKISGVHSDPFFVDWDGDGDLDMVTGSSDGNIFWAENIREAAAEGKETTSSADRSPVLTALKVLIKTPGSKDSPHKGGPTYGIRVHVADVTGDGKLDILAGDRFYTTGTAPDLTEEQKAEFDKANKEYQEVTKEYMEGYNKYRAEYDKAVEEAKKEKGEDLTREEMAELSKKHIADKVNNDEELTKLRNKMSELSKVLTKYRVPSITGGNVWLYEQK